MKKMVLFAFNGDPMCFIHVLLNSLDLADRGLDGRIVVEGSATGLIPEISKPGHPLHQLYGKTKSRGLIAGVCRACSVKMGSAEAVQAEGLTFLDDMSGHPSMFRWIADGFDVISFG